MSKHTPGPYLRTGSFVYALTKDERGRDRNRFSAHVYGVFANGQPKSDEETEATARLFEASPDLYDAAVELLGVYPCLVVNQEFEAAVEKLRAAVKKANGK